MRAETALEVVLRRTSPETHRCVLDIGAGGGEHSKVFADRGHDVTAIDLGVSKYYQRGWWTDDRWQDRVRLIKADLAARDSFQIYDGDGYTMDHSFHVVWASHILEHLPNVDQALRRMVESAALGGVLAITVPLRKDAVVGGHLSLWTPGLLVYRMIVAGIDCRDATVLCIGEEISVIVEPRPAVPHGVLDALHRDTGDVDRLAEYFPAGWDVHEGFDGVNVPTVGW